MKNKLTNANFPMDVEGRVYHVGVKRGETANRIITVGDHVRARRIAKLLDGPEVKGRTVFELVSQRGFTTFTGTYQGVPVSIIAIGMGTPMVDFLLREIRACVEGPIAIIRFGSCGSLNALAGCGDMIVPSGAYSITRNYDHFLDGHDTEPAYHFSKVFDADPTLSRLLAASLTATLTANTSGCKVITGGLNATTDSFYSTQGRSDPAFRDDNERLVEEILPRERPGTDALEMETAALFHLARCANPKNPVRAAATMMVFANRVTNEFITPEVVDLLEPAAGKAVLEALIKVELEQEHPEKGSVWERIHVEVEA
ncbi:nucleoside phosphorylase domain-containing protein [Jimgerdemannia flammicorona]|uniref:Nucleoside phosphorylase domain-containing protein n=1 Tax=Jimgerdemannia flammicorona TaxID=994334 RepID=A0A433CZY8_9FUNG|nr:nucleoside phosphorylase domain-containing protein [Jimgerdemannia flammicorona]